MIKRSMMMMFFGLIFPRFLFCCSTERINSFVSGFRARNFVVVKEVFGIAYVMMNFSENLRRDRKKEVFELSHRDREFICGLSDEEKRLSVCLNCRFIFTLRLKILKHQQTVYDIVDLSGVSLKKRNKKRYKK